MESTVWMLMNAVMYIGFCVCLEMFEAGPSIFVSYSEFKNLTSFPLHKNLLSICMHLTTREWLNRFQWHLILKSCSKICQHTPLLLKLDNNNRHLTWRPICSFVCWNEWVGNPLPAWEFPRGKFWAISTFCLTKKFVCTVHTLFWK
jgi:hypothetical protein